MLALWKNSYLMLEEFTFQMEIIIIQTTLRLSLVAQMVKECACNARDTGLIPGMGRSPGERNGNPLQYACLENSMDRGAWWATVQGVAKSRTGLSD